jgi:hypothetical protein
MLTTVNSSTSPESIPGIIIYILPQGGVAARDIDKYDTYDEIIN